MVNVSRRGFLAAGAAGFVAALTAGKVLGGKFGKAYAAGRPVRPPGSLPEDKFLAACVRCGSCIKACPTGVLQPLDYRQGFEGLWTAYADANLAGCDLDCNRCGQVCPTGTIRNLPLAQKQAARMGRATVDRRTCLPHAGKAECLACMAACSQAGHEAIERELVHVELDESEFPVLGSGFSGPAVLEDKCVGCGMCQSACYKYNVSQSKLSRAAIIVRTGGGREDRITRGSYIELRQRRERQKERRRRQQLLEDGLSENYFDEGSGN